MLFRSMTVISGVEKTIKELWHLDDWTHGFAMATALYGTVLGAAFGGIPADKFGRKKTLFWIGLSFLISSIGAALANDVNALSTNSWLFAPAFIIPMAGAYRLARFNLDQSQSTYFKGVPIPMIGILTAVFPLIYWQPSYGVISKLLLSPLFWYGYIVVVSYLMVMTRPMLALKSLAGKKKLLVPLGIVLLEIVISAFFFKWYAIPFGFIGYCIVSLMYPKTITQ